MLTILMPVGVGKTQVTLKWLPRYTLFLAKLEEEGRPFLERASLDSSSKLSLTYDCNVSYYKNVYHSLSTLPVGIGNT